MSITFPPSLLHSTQDRVTRVKLNYYKQLLQADIKLAEKACSNHEGRYESLQIEFAEQKGQLTRWGLESLIKNFRMQSWLRQSRGELLMNMTKHIIQTLQTKLTEVTELLAFLNIKNTKDKKPPAASSPVLPDHRQQLDTITDAFYSSPETLLEKDKDFLKKRQRLSAIDKLCHMASTKFRESLPELNSKDFAERSRIILSIVKRYSSLLDSKNLCMNSDIAVNGSWHDFSVWYEEKSAKELQLYEEYLQFIDDEREREGRLFRRWCNLVRGSHVLVTTSPDDFRPSSSPLPPPPPSHPLSTFATLTDAKTKAKSGTEKSDSNPSSLQNAASLRPGNTDTGNNNSNDNSNGGGGNGPNTGEKVGTIEANAAYIIYPKCVQIFIRYFAINIIAATHELPQPLHSALLALTETVIHRTVHSSLFRYPSEELRRKDRAWRVHALRCRHVNPISYHIAPKHLGMKPTRVTPAVTGTESEEKENSAPIPLSSLQTHIAAVSSLGGILSPSTSRSTGTDTGTGGGDVTTLTAPSLSRSVSSPIIASTPTMLHALVEEDESEDREKDREQDKDSDNVTPMKSVAAAMTTPPSASSSSTASSLLSLSPASDLSLLTPPPSPPLPLSLPPKQGGFTTTPPTSRDVIKKKGPRSSSTGTLPTSSSSSGRSRGLSRVRSSSSSGLAAIGGKTAYCEKILQNITIIEPLHKRLEHLLANSLDKTEKSVSVTVCSEQLDAEGKTPSSSVEFEKTSELTVPPPLIINLHPAVFRSVTSAVVFSAKGTPPPKQQQEQELQQEESEEARRAAAVALYALPARVMGLLQLAVSPRVRPAPSSSFSLLL